MQEEVKVPRRIAAVIINSLKGGVVPRIGLPYITVGRETEIQALLHDLALIADGGASFRFLVGRYGAGKSFLIQTIRTHAMGENFVVADADLSPERRLQGGQGQGLATYRELIRNLSTKTRPEGGALSLILERWVRNLQQRCASRNTSLDPADALISESRAFLAPMKELVHGFDFAQVLERYVQATIEEDDELKSYVAKWLRGEYRTKTESRNELGVNSCITDDSWYDYLKLLAEFLTGAGYKGLLVMIDELVNHNAPEQLREDLDHVQRYPAGQGPSSGHHHGWYAAINRRSASWRVQLRGATQQACTRTFRPRGAYRYAGPCYPP